MLENGDYSAWFKTPQGQGTATISLADGTIVGRDNVLEYRGSFEQDGQEFKAVIKSHRFCEGPTTLIGIDEFELKLEGRSSGTVAFCSGTIDMAPALILEVTLIRRAKDR